MQTILKQTEAARADHAGGGSRYPVTEVPLGRRGELLIYRPRNTESRAISDVASDRAHEPTVVIRYGGRDYRASRSMAESFARRAGAIIAEGGSDLVPLLHLGGIDLLLVTGSTVIDIERSSL